MSKKLLFHFTAAPYGSTRAKDALDTVLAASAYEQDISLLFSSDGVFQLLKTQDGHAAEQKNLASLLSVFPMYDIDKIFVQASALSQRNLKLDQLAVDAKPLADSDVAALMNQQDSLFSF